MCHLTKGLSLFLLVAEICCAASGAQHISAGTPSSEQPPERRRRVENDRAEKRLTIDQQRALWVMDQLFEAAKEVEDLYLRITTQAKVADALWEYDEARARSMFENLWRAIDSLKPVGQPGQDASPPLAADLRNQLRSEVLKFISAHDLDLARRLIAAVAEKSINEESNHAEISRRILNGQAELYLHLAMNLVDRDPPRAFQLARLSLSSEINPELTELLFQLRRKAPVLADELFSHALTLLRRDPAHLIENIDGLSSYVFPNYASGVSFLIGQGMGQESVPAEQSNPALIGPFLDVAYKALMQQAAAMRTNATSFDSSLNSEQIAASYMVVQAILPFFEQYMPDRATALGSWLSEPVYSAQASAETSWLSNSSQPVSVEELINKADSAQKPEARDSYYMRAARLALQNGDTNAALSLSEQINDARKKADFKSHIRYQAAMAALDKGDVDAAYDFGRDIPNMQQRALVFGKIVQLLSDKRDLARATEMLNDAELMIGKSENDPSKARAMIIIANVAARLDLLRGFEIMRSVVKAINQAEPARKPQARAKTDNQANGAAMPKAAAWPRTLNFESSFQLLARSDFDGALLLARMIENKQASVLAQLAVCRGTLLKPTEPRQ
ncbi:MAG: hypothetical protein V7641_4184 [Blastocatellia bacterium]